jgi:hypothetical protein
MAMKMKGFKLLMGCEAPSEEGLNLYQGEIADKARFKSVPPQHEPA